MLKNKKGFSLVELIVVVAILIILAAAFVPTFVSSITDAQKKSDETKIDNLKSTVQMAAQNAAIYKNGKKIADMSDDGNIVIEYEVDQNNIMVFTQCSAIINDAEMTDENKVELEKFKEDIEQYVSGVIEPIQLESNLYKSKDYKITLTFNPDVQFSVDASMLIINK